MSFKSVAIGCVLTSTVLSVQSLTLGRARGAAWIGQPLELVIPVQLDAGQTESAVCAEADVFHADSRQDPARVRVNAEPTAQPDTFNVRIVSSALVDEPVVTVYLRAGCNPKSSRKYVLLADFPSEASAPLSRAPEPVAPVVPTIVPATSPPVTAGAAAPVASASPSPVGDTTKPAPVAAQPAAPRPPKPVAERKDTIKAPVKKPIPVADDKPATAAPAAPKPTASNKPRLKLDPLENLTERIKTLESTTVALPPEGAASDTERMERLQNDVRALLEQAAKNEASLSAMRQRMEKAESERVPMGVVYGLVALVLACLAGLAFLWTRRSAGPAWEQGAPLAPLQTPQASHEPTTEQQEETLPRAAVTARAAIAPQPEMDVDVNLMDLDEESFSKLMDTPQPGAKAGS